MIKGNISKLALITIVLALLIGSVSVFCKTYYDELIGDDLLWSFVLKEKKMCDRDVTTSAHIESLADVVQSQYHQYFGNGGRVFVCGLGQMFDGPWGLLAFSVFNSLLFVCVISAFVMCTQRKNRGNPIIWCLLLICLLYLFPAPNELWYVPSLSVNYLFPMLTSIIFLLLLKRAEESTYSGMMLCLACVFSFFAGWMHESYSIPISGAMFMWMLVNRKKLNRNFLSLAIFFGVGSFIMIVAPGNFNRLVGSRMSYIFNAIELLTQLKIVWITVVVLFVYGIKDRTGLKNIIKSNQLIFYILMMSILFAFVANNGTRSMIGVEFSSAIILFRTIDLYFENKRGFGVPHSVCLFVCLFVCLRLAHINT